MKLQGRSVDQWGNVVFASEGLIDLLMQKAEIPKGISVHESSDILKFNNLCVEFDHPEDKASIYSTPEYSVLDSDQAHQSIWFTPEPYSQIDLLPWLLDKCKTTEEVQRVEDEWALFIERDMEQVLRSLIYMVDTFRQNNIVWGVGRGSSVASYVLYLIGIHRVNSMEYELDIREFLK